MRLSTLVIAISVLGATTFVSAETPSKHDFANLQRLSQALSNFNYPERGTNSITIWLQGAGVGNSSTSDKEVLDLTTVVKMWRNKLNEVDFANVAVLQADGRNIHFVDMQEFVKTDKPSGVTVRRGDLVALLKSDG